MDHAMDVERFLQPGPLWWGFDWRTAEKRSNGSPARRATAGPSSLARTGEPSGCVVLIDEIDKADPSVPNGLLDALGQRRLMCASNRRCSCRSRPHHHRHQRGARRARRLPAAVPGAPPGAAG
ncbi:MAG: AAA family ATPase [bacterium]